MASEKVPFLKKLIEWTKSLALRKSAEYWLAFISFIESSFFPLPADILYIPMVCLNRSKAYYYATIATLSSILGTLFGWAIGHFAFQTIALPLLEFYGKAQYFTSLREQNDLTMILILLLTSGFSHIPPIKVVTILAGFLNVNIWLFLLASIITRFARFFLLAWLIKNHSEKISHFLISKFKSIAISICIVLILGYIFFYYL